MNYREQFYIDFFEKYPDVFTIEELAQLLDVQVKTVKEYWFSKIQNFKIKNQYYFPKQYILQFILSDTKANNCFNKRYLEGLKVNLKQAYQLYCTDYPDILDVVQMREILNISKKSAYKLLTSHQIEHFKIGRCYRIPKHNIFLYAKLIQPK